MSDLEFLTPKGKSLSDMVTQHDTVSAQNCDRCGNPWWFKFDNGVGECTCCAHTELLDCQICGSKAHENAKQIDDRAICAMCIEEKRYVR